MPGGWERFYKAEDTRLKRDVAIKTLPEIFVSDPERLCRFQREAELLASLNTRTSRISTATNKPGKCLR